VSTDPNVAAGWYSPYQQYTPPKIKYVPVATKPQFGICELQDATGGNSSTGTIMIAQLPGKPPIVKGSLTGFTASSSNRLTIRESAALGAACATAGTADEYNPLTEKDKYGRANPYQDPSRGRLVDLVVTSAGANTEYGQNYLLQNLEGKDSIIGRGITICELSGTAPNQTCGTTPVVVACCVIARDVTPARYAPIPVYPYAHSHGHASQSHGHGHGHGHSYGNQVPGW
jgi:hypothetical protein